MVVVGVAVTVVVIVYSSEMYNFTRLTHNAVEEEEKNRWVYIYR